MPSDWRPAAEGDESVESEAQEARSLNCQWLRSDAQVVYVALQGHVRLAEAGVLRELMQALDDRPPKTTYLDLQGSGPADRHAQAGVGE
jgi:hypothetical protein